MNNEEIYIEIKNPPLCIICLEELNGNIKKICVNCDVKCHEKCLRNWHKSKKKPVCPICLKTKKFYQKKVKVNNEVINIEQENIEQENIEEGNVEEENMEEENIEEENEYNTDEEDNREEEIINYYLNRRAADRGFNYYLMRDICTSKRYLSYFFICAIGIYIYEVMN